MFKKMKLTLGVTLIILVGNCGSDKGNLTAPDENLIGPITKSSQIKGTWELEEFEVNGISLSAQIIDRGGYYGSGKFHKYFELKSFSGQLTFTPSTETGGTFSTSESASIVNKDNLQEVVNGSKDNAGQFNIAESGIIVIALTSSPGEDPYYLGKPFMGKISFVNGKLHIEFLQKDFSTERGLWPTYGSNLVDNQTLSTKVVGKFKLK